jgi:hypothetical protein
MFLVIQSVPIIRILFGCCRACWPHLVEIDPYIFETVYNFTYLQSEINCKNYISTEIKKRILSAGRCFYGPTKLLKSKLISRKTKLLMSKTLLRPVLTYAPETWLIFKADDRSLGLFERRLLRCILEQCRIKMH